MLTLPRAAAKAALAALAAATMLVGAQPADAQGTAAEVTAIGEQVRTLRGQLSQIRPQIGQPERIALEYSFASAFVDARYLFFYESYDAVIQALLPLVEDDRHRANGGYAEAVYMLAESLFLERDLLMAGHYYERLAEDPTHSLDAARRRIEIAVAMGRFDELERLYRDLERRAGTAMDDDVSYVRGKALYFQGRYADAVNAFGAVRPSADVYELARYFTGVAMARMDQLEPAYAEFTGVLERLGEPSAEDSDTVVDLRELSRLAQGRIHYENSAWLEAIDAYILVPRQSPHYTAALYEIAWTQIRQGAETDQRTLRDQYFETALNNLEILTIVADQDSRFQAQAQLLRGDLLLRMERYDEAVEQFETANAQYLPVEQELRAVRAEHDDPDAFFDAIVNPEAGSLRLPVAAQPWFESDPQLDRALMAIQDVEVLRTEIDESALMIEQLDAVLNRGGRLNAFPTIRDSWARANAIQVEVTDLMGALVDAEATAVVPGMAQSDASQYETLRRRRLAIQARLSDQPRTFAELNERERSVTDEIGRLILETHRAELMVNAEAEDLEALREIYIDRAGAAPRADLRNMRSSLDAESRRLNTARAETLALRRELNIRLVEVGVSDGVGSAERQSRAEFFTAIGAEERFLAARRANASNPSALTNVDPTIGELMAIDRDCESLYLELDQLLAEQTADMRGLLARERANVEQYQASLPLAEAEARATAGTVAFAAFEDIYYRFSELTLRANLGIIDVAWRQKEVLSHTIENLFEERNQSIRELDADFEELLEDE